MKATMYCAKCGIEYPPDENFCGNCGGRLVEKQSNHTPAIDSTDSLDPESPPTSEMSNSTLDSTWGKVDPGNIRIEIKAGDTITVNEYGAIRFRITNNGIAPVNNFSLCLGHCKSAFDKDIQKISGRLNSLQSRQARFQLKPKEAGDLIVDAEAKFFDEDNLPYILESDFEIRVNRADAGAKVSVYDIGKIYSADAVNIAGKMGEPSMYRSVGPEVSEWQVLDFTLDENSTKEERENLPELFGDCPYCNEAIQRHNPKCPECRNTLPSFFKKQKTYFDQRREKDLEPHFHSELILEELYRRVYIYTKSEVELGRHRNNDIVLRFMPLDRDGKEKSLRISNFHAKLTFQENAFQLLTDKITATWLDGQNGAVFEITGEHELEVANALKLKIKVFKEMRHHSKTVKRGDEAAEKVTALRIERLNNIPNAESYIVAPELFSIGRAPDNCLVLADDSVADYHARIVFTAERLWLESLTNRAPTLINGRKVESEQLVLLKHNDEIQFGNLTALLHPRERWVVGYDKQ